MRIVMVFVCFCAGQLMRFMVLVMLLMIIDMHKLFVIAVVMYICGEQTLGM